MMFAKRLRERVRRALGRLASATSQEPNRENAFEFDKIRLLTSLIAMFFVGEVIGALGFKHEGFFFTVPLAALLLLLAIMPMEDDMRRLDKMRLRTEFDVRWRRRSRTEH